MTFFLSLSRSMVFESSSSYLERIESKYSMGVFFFGSKFHSIWKMYGFVYFSGDACLLPSQSYCGCCWFPFHYALAMSSSDCVNFSSYIFHLETLFLAKHFASIHSPFHSMHCGLYVCCVCAVLWIFVCHTHRIIENKCVSLNKNKMEWIIRHMHQRPHLLRCLMETLLSCLLWNNKTNIEITYQ